MHWLRSSSHPRRLVPLLAMALVFQAVVAAWAAAASERLTLRLMGLDQPDICYGGGEQSGALAPAQPERDLADCACCAMGCASAAVEVKAPDLAASLAWTLPARAPPPGAALDAVASALPSYLSCRTRGPRSPPRAA